jgi:hypothetical protein
MKLMLLLAAIALSFSGCASLLHSNCENTVKVEVRSPNSKYVATTFERNCGATTDFSTIVDLRESSAKFKDVDSSVVVVKGQHKLDLVWDGNAKLRIECRDCRAEDIFKHESSWEGIAIDFVH